MEYGSNITNAPKEYYNGPKEKYERKVEGKWWGVEERIHEHVWPLYEQMKKQQSFRSSMNLKFARLYENMELVGLKAGQHSRVTDPKMFMTNRVTYNVIKSCIDSATSKISKMKPRPVYLTDNGNWLLQQKAKRLNQFILGMFDQIGTGQGDDKTMYGLGRQNFRDACVFGEGVTYIYECDGKIKAERNLSEELIVDEVEGMYRTPRQMHRHRYVSREVLLDKYGSDNKAFKAIKELAAIDEMRDGIHNTSDMVETLESWHLPSGKDAKDGKHILTIENYDLLVEDYKDNFFPFLIQRWSQRLLGFYGMGLAEELAGIQLEINKLLRTIQQSQHLMAVPQVWVEYQSKTITKKLDNKIGGIKYYSGRPPVSIVPQAMSSEVYQHLETLYRRAYEITGISLLSATSQKPSGLDSAVALREYKDTESERFATQEASYEMWYIEAAEMIRKLCRRMTEEGREPTVIFRDGVTTKTIKFSDVDIPDDQISVQPYPANLLPKEPAGRLAAVQELTQGGFYTKEEALDLLEFPDVAKVNKVKLGPRNVVISTIETMIEENKYIPPEPFMNLMFAREYAQDYYSNGKAEGMPEERLELLRRFMAQVTKLINESQAPAPMTQMQPGVAEAPPTSDLLPIQGAI